MISRTLTAPALVRWVAEEPEQTPEVIPTGDCAEAWEVACVRRTQGGDSEAFNPLVTHYAPRIRAYLQRMLRNREEAEDLTQETFLKAFRALERFDADRPFKRWLYTIATNTGLNALRGQKNRGTQVELDPEFPASHHGSDGVGGGSASGEQLDRALTTLQPRALQLIRLHYHEGFSLQEAGAVLGMSEGAAKAALCRARQELRKRITNEGSAPSRS